MMGEPIRDVEALYAGEPQPSGKDERLLQLARDIAADVTAERMAEVDARNNRQPSPWMTEFCRFMRGGYYDDCSEVRAALRALSPTPQPSEGERELAGCLQGAALQLEYLDGRFPTGTTPGVLAQINATLAKFDARTGGDK